MPDREPVRERRGYVVHGLRIRSEVPLDAPDGAEGLCDIEVTWGERRPIPDETAPGVLLSYLELPVGSSSLVRDDQGFTLRVHNLCEFEIDSALRAVRVHLAPDADHELGQLLIGGTLALVLVLRGNCVLHASAVESEGHVLAFVGGSGMGKSTVAALCCAAGARLVTDDVLRVESDHAGGWCFGGSTEVRLRQNSAELVNDFHDSARRSTVDARVAVRPARGEVGRHRISAIVAPLCVHGADELKVMRLHGANALLELARAPRTIGWIDEEPLRRDFGVLASLAEQVPIFRAQLPWGPPFQPDLADALLDAIRSE
jgi:hypothetical protein